MDICVLHHVEPMWENSFDREELILNIQDHLERNSYDMVILTTLEYTDGYPELKPYWNRLEEWGYGWEDPEEEKEWYADCNIDISDIIPARGHEFAYVYPWIKELKNATWHLMGGAENECLQDLIDTLEHLDIRYFKINDCIF